MNPMTSHSSKTILVIEDEAPIRELLRLILSQGGFKMMEAENSQTALALLANELPDLILLDWMLPGISGLEIARSLKNTEKYQDIPIIMLTARAAEDNKVKGLEAGADDYIVKPFSPRELIARIQAVLRRSSKSAEGIELGGIRIELDTKQITIDGKSVKLRPLEFRLLYFLLSHPNRIFSREQLLDRVWKEKLDIHDRSVDVSIRRLRKVLGENHKELIETVHGSGYRFKWQKTL
jgi:two-component system, OmpR family, phosphate regulon response regulator PhoB